MMKEISKAGITSLVLSLLTALFAWVVLFSLGFLFHGIFSGGFMVRILTYSGYNIFITIACFLICKNYPVSVWYAPIICNASSIIGAVTEPDFWGPFIFYKVGWVVSLSGGILGSVIGRRRAKKVQQHLKESV